MGNKLYVGNLPYSVRDEDLQQSFGQFRRCVLQRRLCRGCSATSIASLVWRSTMSPFLLCALHSTRIAVGDWISENHFNERQSLALGEDVR